VQTHADAQPAQRGPVLPAEGTLGVDGAGERIARSCEHRVDPVARRLHDVPAVGLDRLPQDRVVSCHRGRHRLGLVFPQPSRAFDIGEEERHGAGGQFGHAEEV
jgi:hypothetical protein